jgi:EpsI family protein
MIARRDFILGAACVLAAGAAQAIRPRNRIEYIGSAKLGDITPTRFGPWRQVHVGDVIQARTEGTLAAELYSQMVGRVYANDSDDYVMLALAYGDTQSDLLQLHRPETCYPAFGFEISQSILGSVAAGGANVPTRSLMAKAPNRTENVTYWTRIGEYLPRTQTEQREDKLRTSFAGIVPDGILVRASSLGDDWERGIALNRQFLRDLVLAIDPKYLPVFVGTHLAAQVRGATLAAR